ncbi:MAG: DUF2975 domain-containing protein [Clostridia bacterium]|nr:DUF2975 domain-containing protein [Clostridia bacterium]
MWNYKKSALLSLIFIYLFSGVFLLLEATAPWAVKGFIALYAKNTDLQIPLTVFIYAMLPPVGYALSLLRQWLIDANKGNGFCKANVTRLRHLSWCFFLAAAVLLVFGFFYTPLMILVPFSAFAGLVVRVVKNAFQTALELQTENELTI